MANHTGVFDILWMVAQHAPAFVSKASMRDTPILGKIMEQLLDCIFVDRTASSGSRKVNVPSGGRTIAGGGVKVLKE